VRVVDADGVAKGLKQSRPRGGKDNAMAVLRGLELASLDADSAVVDDASSPVTYSVSVAIGGLAEFGIGGVARPGADPARVKRPDFSLAGCDSPGEGSDPSWVSHGADGSLVDSPVVVRSGASGICLALGEGLPCSDAR